VSSVPPEESRPLSFHTHWLASVHRGYYMSTGLGLDTHRGHGGDRGDALNTGPASVGS
jgi:hypothetical protein